MTAARRKPARPDAHDALLSLAARTPGAKVLSVAQTPAAKKGRPSKYRNVPTTHNGLPYQSKAEAKYAAHLDLQLKAGIIQGWTRQVTFRLGVPENIYRVDFLIFAYDSVVAVDVKGHRTSKFERDMKLWKRYGACRLQIVTGGKVVETIVPESIDWARPDAKGGEN